MSGSLASSSPDSRGAGALLTAAAAEQPGAHRRKRGRPRSFSVKAVLRRASFLYAERGFHGVNLHAICAATGISRPSLAAAFGDRPGLYREVLAWIGRLTIAELATAVGGSPAGGAVAALLRQAARVSCGRGGLPCGCLLLGAPPATSSSDSGIAAITGAFRTSLRSLSQQACRLDGPGGGRLPPAVLHMAAEATEVFVRDILADDRSRGEPEIEWRRDLVARLLDPARPS